MRTPHYYGSYNADCGLEVPELQKILSNRAIMQLCTDLTAFIKTTPIQILDCCYTEIVDHVFGLKGQPGWALRAITKGMYPKETDVLLELLGPEGALLQLAIGLMGDMGSRYDFPIAYLPKTVVDSILRNGVPAHFPQSVSFKFNSLNPQYLSLTPFEYYFFAFATVQTQTITDQNGVIGTSANISDNVYSSLLEDFLAYFLPTDKISIPQLKFKQDSAVDPAFVSGNFSHMLFQRQPYAAPTQPKTRIPKLVKPTALLRDTLSGPRDLPLAQGFCSENPDIWMSESVLNIFLVMWLSFERDGGSLASQFETLMPSTELVKSVRIMTKHFHFFNNAVASKVLHPLEEIKRVVFPVFQKRLYHMLRYLFYHWPMDPSFKIVYETWLSYIQPWRYVDSKGVAREEEIQVDKKWSGFVAENLVFYTYLFKDILIRLAKSDLSATKNAHMLFRVVKVFTSNKTLRSTLKEVEKALLSSEQGFDYSPFGSTSLLRHRGNYSVHSSIFSTPSYSTLASASSSQQSFSSQPFSETFGGESFLGLSTSQIKQAFYELQGANSTYDPLFSTLDRKLVQDILSVVKNIIEGTKQFINDPTRKASSNSGQGLMKTIFSSNNAETTSFQLVLTIQQEKVRLLEYLENSRNPLARFFDIVLEAERNEIGMGNCEAVDLEERSSTRLATKRNFLDLTKQEYFGHPDYTPPRADETFAVIKALSILSQFLNSIVMDKIKDPYFERNFVGSILRSTFASPVWYQEIAKQGPGTSIRVRKYLGPRIVLRPLGTLSSIITIAGFIVVGIYLGTDGVILMLLAVLCYGVYVVLRALLEPSSVLESLRRDFDGMYED